MSAIDIDDLCDIRKALIIGLTSYEEIEHLRNVCQIRELAGAEIPEGMHPLDPTGDANTVSHFATALTAVGMMEDERMRKPEA